mgnify:CR=1 FL=1
MPAYAYPIEIKNTPQVIKYDRVVDIGDGVLTLPMLNELVTEDESFSVLEKENSIYGSSYVLCVSGSRLETEDELRIRVEREEKYMAEYNKRHNR